MKAHASDLKQDQKIEIMLKLGTKHHFYISKISAEKVRLEFVSHNEMSQRKKNANRNFPKKAFKKMLANVTPV